MTQDIGTALLRFQDYPDLDRQVYTVGNEQEYHFKVLFLVLGKLGFPQAERCHHLSYGMVELPEGKMKSREGTVVDADDLMEEMFGIAREIAQEAGKLEGLDDEAQREVFERVGLSALKYFLLKVDPKKNMMFDPKASIDFYGNTGPFILFNYVRGRSILRRARRRTALPTSLRQVPGPDEMELIGCLSQLCPMSLPRQPRPTTLPWWPIGATTSPKRSAAITKTTPSWQRKIEPTRDLRMVLTERFTRSLKTGMHLLGIALPERM